MPQCFFVEPSQSDLVLLPEDKTHHITHVLKLKQGELIQVHDGQNRAATARLELLGKKRISARLTTTWSTLSTEPSVRITIYQGLPKTGDKVEQVLQHGTELGAAGFVLFPSEKAQAKLEERERIVRKVARWEELVRNAAEQSGRGTLPTVGYCRDLTTALATVGTRERIVLDATGVPVAQLGSTASDLAVFVGPESGFTAEELQQLGGKRATLGPRTLRTETAALAGIVQILAHRGE